MAADQDAPVVLPPHVWLAEAATLDTIERQIERVDMLISDLYRRRFRLVDEWEALKAEQYERKEFFG